MVFYWLITVKYCWLYLHFLGTFERGVFLKAFYKFLFIFLFVLTGAIFFSLPAFAISSQANGTTVYNQTIYVDPSGDYPFTGSSTTVGDSVNIYFREKDSYYIRYPAGSTFKRGYVPVSAVSVSTPIILNQYNSWYTKLLGSANQSVYLCPENSSLTVGTIGQADPLLVLGDEGNQYYIQYSTTGANKKRGYISKSLVNGNTYSSWYAKISDGANHDVFAYTNEISTNKVGTVFGTDPILVIGQDGNYYYIKYPASGAVKTGYINKAYITNGNKPISGLSVVNFPLENVSNGVYTISVKISDDLNSVDRRLC